MTSEKPIWLGSPSQILNLSQFLLWSAVLIALLAIGIATLRSMETPPGAGILALILLCLIPLFILLWHWLVLKNTRYELTTERLKFRSGVFNKEMDEVELYRVRDYRAEQPFFLRLFSLGNLILQTSDRSNPVVVLRAIKGWQSRLEEIRTYVEACRQRKGVRDLEVD